MKIGVLKSKGLFFVAMFCMTLLYCESSDNATGTENGEFLRANIDGNPFVSSSSFDSVTVSKITTDGVTTLIIQGVDDSGSAIVLVASEYNGEETYDLSFDSNPDDASGSGLYFNQEAAWNSLDGESGMGSITIDTETETEIIGTFEFVGYDGNNQNSSRDVTNGRFEARFDSQ